MLSIKPYYSEDYKRLLPLLQNFAPHISLEAWGKILEYKWVNKIGYRGMILENEGQVVGFLSYILNQKEINGIEITFCNISSWIVNPEYRSKSLQLLSPLFKIQNIVILNLSPHENTLSVFNALRFNKLSEFEYLINPFKLKLHNLFSRNKYVHKIEALTIDSISRNEFSHYTKSLIHDHLPYKNVVFYKLVVLKDNISHDLILAVNEKKLDTPNLKNQLKELPYKLFNKKKQVELLYCSSSELLCQHFNEICTLLIPKTGARILNVSEHFIDKIDLHLKYVSKTKKDRPMFFYSDTNIRLCEINFLYSEKILLNF